jgi:transcriptional regulator with XRE-family HTH domain
VEHLFDAIRNPRTGEPYTNADVARMTLGDLCEEDVEKIRTGAIGDPSVSQVGALASVFGVEPSYLLDREEPPLLDEELVQALRDEDVRAITRESSRLPERERRLVLGIVRQFRDQKAPPSGWIWREPGEPINRHVAIWLLQIDSRGSSVISSV